MRRTTLYYLTLICLMALGITSCSGGGSSSREPTDPVEPEVVEPRLQDETDSTGSVISGKAIKGVIKNGKVSIFAVVDGDIQSDVIASATTDNTGGYEVTLPLGFSGPVYILIGPSLDGSATMMTCDVQPNCGEGVPFGSDLQVESDFSLSALLPEVIEAREVVHLTALTGVAASYALNVLGANADNIAAANERVADMFGLEGSVINIQPVDITQSDVVETTDDEALHYSLLSAAFYH